MNPELIAILGIAASLAALIVQGQHAVPAERQAIRGDLHSLGERVARLEGAFPFLARPTAMPPESPSTPPA